MTLVKYPNTNMFRSGFNLGVDDFWGFPLKWVDGSYRSDWSPAIDIKEEDQSFLLKVDLPGVKRDEIDISVENDIMTVSGKREEESGDLTRRERFYGEFSRSFRLGNQIDADNIKADMVDGVLILTLPKSESSLPKKIKIK